MSMFIDELMAVQYGYAPYQQLLNEVRETVRVWWQRHVNREELTHWSERELHDIGRSRSDVEFEAAKPFWQT